MTKQQDVRHGWAIQEALPVGLQDVREGGEGWFLERRWKRKGSKRMNSKEKDVVENKGREERK